MSDKSNDAQNKTRIFVEKRRRAYRKKILTSPESARRGVRSYASALRRRSLSK